MGEPLGALLALLVLLLVAACAYWRGVVTGYEAGIDETREQLWEGQHRGARARAAGDQAELADDTILGTTTFSDVGNIGTGWRP